MRVFKTAPAPAAPAPGPAEDPAPPAPAVPGPASGPRRPRFRGPLAQPFRPLRLRGPLLLFAASLLLTAAGAGLLALAAQLRGSPPAANGALTDAAATRQVTASVSAGVSQIYSYSYTDLAATRAAARRVLAGRAAAQYRQLSPELGAAVSQRLTVVTKVTSIGVSSLTAGSARLLVFLDQTVTRAGAKPNAPVPAQLTVTATRSGGRWLITSIQTA